MKHLLVTNDFAPKIGGIQTYLFEIYRRIDPSKFSIITTSYKGSEDFDSKFGANIERLPNKVLFATKSLERVIRSRYLAGEYDFVVLDPLFPLGLIGPRLKSTCQIRYGIIVHGAEANVVLKIPLIKSYCSKVLSDLDVIVAAGNYPRDVVLEGLKYFGLDKPIINIAPGVDWNKFSPADPEEKIKLKTQLNIDQTKFTILSVSRLVPRKGMDTLIKAVSMLGERRNDVLLIIVGEGRDLYRLKLLAKTLGVDVRITGSLDNESLIKYYKAADLFAMLCRDRWFGLEKEGFGIVFLEAAACGLAQLAGKSGGSADAVIDGITGFILENPKDAGNAAQLISRLMQDRELLAKLASAASLRAQLDFSYDKLASLYIESLEQYFS
jgi:phosphatidylinositol alpha-1,6-mannosyltransferase